MITLSDRQREALTATFPFFRTRDGYMSADGREFKRVSIEALERKGLVFVDKRPRRGHPLAKITDRGRFFASLMKSASSGAAAPGAPKPTVSVEAPGAHS